MIKRGRPPVEITLTGTERRQLQSWARRHSSAQNLARRCKIILLCEDPALTGAEIAAKVGCNPATVSKWRKRSPSIASTGSSTNRARVLRARSVTTSWSRS